MLKHVYQNPRYGFEPSSALLGEEEAQRLVTICQDKIVNDRDPVTELMRMQVKTAFPQKTLIYFKNQLWASISNSQSVFPASLKTWRSDVLASHRRDCESRCAAVAR